MHSDGVDGFHTVQSADTKIPVKLIFLMVTNLGTTRKANLDYETFWLYIVTVVLLASAGDFSCISLVKDITLFHFIYR